MPKINETAHVPEWTWIRPINRGKSCGVRFGNLIKILAIHEDNLLVIYDTNNKGKGTECLLGTQFIIKKYKFQELEDQYKQEKLERDNMDSLTKTLLSKVKNE